MSNLVTLCLPRGMDTWTFPISHGDRCYTPYRADHTNPDSDWYVDVPPDVARHLTHRGGFTLVPTSFVVHSAGTIRMRNDAGTGCGWGGIAFKPDEDGVVEVPIEAAGDLTSHGFQAAPPKSARKRKPEPPVPVPLPASAAVAAPEPVVQGSDRPTPGYEKDVDGTHPDAPPKK
jgi:hypothetical protein